MDPLDLRAETPGLQDVAYLNFGAHGPSPRRVVDAATSFLRTHEYNPSRTDPYEVAFETYDEVRERIATFLGATPEAIALTESTTDGINRIANAIDWEPGDVVVRTDLEHPAGVLPWRRLKKRGVDVRVVETTDGRIDPDAFADAVVDARLACFSALTWTHGTMLPIRELVEIADDAGVFTLVDAVQVPGHRAMDVTRWGADAVAAAGHKWLLGPWGAGFLYVDRNVAGELEPATVGYRSVAEPTGEGIEFKPGAPRFEIGTTTPTAHVGLMEAMDTIDEIGIDAIETRIRALTDRLKTGIAPLDDATRLSPESFESGLVTVAVDDPEATVERLASRDIVAKSVPSPKAVRISVHAVSTESEIDSVVDALATDRP